MEVAAAPSSAPAPRPPRRSSPVRSRAAAPAGMVSGRGGGSLAGGGRGRGAGAARPRRPPPGSRGSLCLGGLAALPGSLEREKGGRARARCTAEPSGPAAPAAAAERTVRTNRVNPGALPVPLGAAAATASASGTGALWGRSPPPWMLGPAVGTGPPGSAGAWLRGKLRVWPGHLCLVAVSVSRSVLR